MTGAALALVLIAGIGATALALQNESGDPIAPVVATADEKQAAAEPSTAPSVPRDPAPRSRTLTEATPMAKRVAVIGLLNKRNGIARDLRMLPGQSVRVGDVIVRLKACETTAPWEQQKLTGAFIQLDVRNRDGSWRRPFSGWLFKESPSLNVVEHPIYDVWPKSCEMVHPDAGPDTVRAESPTEAAPRRSSRPNSAEPGPAPAPIPSASSNNAT